MSTISLVMIVKDEEEILRKSVDAVKSIADEFIIVDTGSTDKTKEIIAEYGKVYEIPFVDFVQTKNESLKLATGDYILFMDADEVVVSGLDKLKEYADKGEYDAVSAHIIEGPLDNLNVITNTYFRHRLWKNDGKWAFQGPGVHEVICGSGKIAYDRDIHVRHEHIKRNKAELANQWSQKYVEILQKALEKNPKDGRALFYLARTYKDLSKFTEAIDIYEEYLTVPDNNFLDERWQAAYDIANCWKRLGEYSKTLIACDRAIKIDPRRAGAYNLKGLIFYNCMEWDNAIVCFQQALNEKIPQDVLLFLNPREYKEIPLDYMAICLDRKKQYDKAFIACKNIYQNNTSDRRIMNNLVWLHNKVNMTIFMTLGHTPEPVYGGMIDKIGVGGVETTYIELSAELAKKGHNVFLFCECEKEHKYNDVYYIPYQKLSEYISLKPDVVITSRWFDALYFEQKSKKIIWLQDAHFADPNHDDAFSIVDGVVCSSLWHRGYIGERFQHGIDNKKITVIPLGIRKELYLESIPRDPYKCIYSSNPDRGLYILVDMWEEITKKIPKIKLVITYGWDGLMTWGKNKQWEDSVNTQKQQTINKLAKFNNVEFKGRLTKRQLAREMLTCSLCLYPNNFWETYCLTALETQAAGVPMITTDRGALPTTLNPHYNKLICNDPYTQKYKETFIDTIDNMLKDRNKLKLNSVGCKDFTMENPTDWKDISDFWQNHIWSLF